MCEDIFNWGDLVKLLVICFMFVCGVVSMSGFTDDIDKGDKK